MQKNGLKTFLEEIKSLPNDLREAILATDFLEYLHDIQKEKSLHIDQASALEETTFELMLGHLDVADFTKTLASSMHISNEAATELSVLVDKKILEPIRQEFQRIQEEEGNEEFDSEESTESSGPKNPSKILQFSENEDHSTLSAEEILSGIENPHPVISSVHGTILPEKMRPSDVSNASSTSATLDIASTTSSAPLVSITNSILSMNSDAHAQETTPSSISQVVSNQKPRLSTADILANAAKQFPSSTDEAAKTIQQQPKAPPTLQTPAQQVSANLQNNLTATTVSKPQNLTQITTSIDPYREKAI